jgi:hypothetical protein
MNSNNIIFGPNLVMTPDYVGLLAISEIGIASLTNLLTLVFLAAHFMAASHKQCVLAPLHYSRTLQMQPSLQRTFPHAVST